MTLATSRPIAPDALALIEAYRAAGEISFQDVDLETARQNYEISCASNGMPRSEVADVRDVVIADRIPARLYRDRPAEIGPAILFIHGGGWVIGSLDTHDGLCRALTRKTGAMVIAVDYRRAPESRYPAAVDDCRAALEWVFAHAEDLHIDPQRIVLVGDSAGGQMATVLANEYALGGHRECPVAQVLLYPVTDLGMDSDSYRRVTTGFPLTDRSMRWFADQYAPEGVDRLQAGLSPLRHEVPECGVPAFVVTVDHDPLADEGIAYAAKLASAGTAVEHLHLAGYAHGLFTSAGKIPTGAAVLDRVAAFICAATGTHDLRARGRGRTPSRSTV
ncbi:alpha/beta hydrolase [Rhodococcus sp. WS4]|nr:alpha/beta hydrolase [Rhodococcus sp. WS4]